jgi:hypothetical protein
MGAISAASKDMMINEEWAKLVDCEGSYGRVYALCCRRVVGRRADYRTRPKRVLVRQGIPSCVVVSLLMAGCAIMYYMLTSYCILCMEEAKLSGFTVRATVVESSANVPYRQRRRTGRRAFDRSALNWLPVEAGRHSRQRSGKDLPRRQTCYRVRGRRRPWYNDISI